MRTTKRKMRARAARLELRRWRRDEDLGNVSDCPYYQRWLGLTDTGTCSYGCRDEPSCVTDEPIGGWPRKRPTFL